MLDRTLRTLQMPCIIGLIEKDLSEPYSIFTYRYFINNWPNLCFLVHLPQSLLRWRCLSPLSELNPSFVRQTMSEGECVGTIVCKLDMHKSSQYRGYIAMLAVRKDFRKRGIGELGPACYALVYASPVNLVPMLIFIQHRIHLGAQSSRCYAGCGCKRGRCSA